MVELCQKGPIQCEKEWIEKYGKIVGYYEGLTPVLFIEDLELVKKAFIKDFQYFSDRPETVPLRNHGVVDRILPTYNIFESLLVNLKGQRWKEVRSILTPTFSVGKMKQMVPVVDQAVDVTVTKVGEMAESCRTFDIYEVFRRLTLDVICQAAFAIQMNSQHDPNDPFLRSAKLMFDFPYASKLHFFSKCFPELGTFTMIFNFIRMLIRNRGVIPPMKVTWMITDVIKERRKNSSEKIRDLLQLLIEASALETDVQNVDIKEDAVQNGDKASHLKRKLYLTDTEIQATSLVMFLAGYETTSTALAYAFHFLVKYPKYQDRIRQEVDDLMEKEHELNYFSVNNLKFLDRFLMESMRIYPIAFGFVKRVAMEDVQYGDLLIKKGMHVQLPVHYIHHSDEYWTDPETFDPDRFLPENKTAHFSAAYLPFGIGPRNCLGIRFAMIEAKMVVAKLVYKYIFASGDEGEPKITLLEKINIRIPGQVLVKAYERK